MTKFFDALDFDGALRYEDFGMPTDANAQNEQIEFPAPSDGTKPWAANLESVEFHYNHLRGYNSTVGRWMSQDPIAFAANENELHPYHRATDD